MDSLNINQYILNFVQELALFFHNNVFHDLNEICCL